METFIPSRFVNSSFVVTDDHFNLNWNEKLNLFQTSLCDDTGPGCVRSLFDIDFGTIRLVRIEYKEVFPRPDCPVKLEADRWISVWEGGKWLFEYKSVGDRNCLVRLD